MTAKTARTNPYIAGRALGQQRGFFGREDILRLVEAKLGTPDQNALVLFGQRRIGKTSILLQLQRRLSSGPFLPVYFDLMDRARRPLGQVLFEIAATIAADADMAPVEREQFDDQGSYFRREFLPALYQALGDQRSPVLLLDEFDVLDIAEEQLPPLSAARAFFPYLRELLEGEPRLKFVFVVGRRAEDLSINVKAAFKASVFQRVSVLDEASTKALIATAEQQDSLSFAPEAIDRIIALTSGHPYFVQLLCQLLWDAAYAAHSQGVPAIDVAQVETAAVAALEAGQNIFEWIWDGLPPAERVVFAAIAEATGEHSVVTEDQLSYLLQSYGVRILTRELELAPRTLVEWEMLCKVDGGYQFFIDLMRRWVAINKPLPKVKDELDRIVPLADTLYRSAEGFYRQGDAEGAQDQLRKALRANPNHLKARLLLGQVMIERGETGEALRELEEAYRYDEDAARYPLVRALLVWGEELEQAKKDDDALAIYDRVLEISPREKVALERRRAIWMKSGDEAVKADDLDTALVHYQKAGAQESVERIEILKRKRTLELAATEALTYERQELWNEALEVYERLAAQDPEADYWHTALARIKFEQRLSQEYNEGIEAIEKRDWHKSVRLLAHVVYVRPAYKDAMKLLAYAINEQQGKPRVFESFRAAWVRMAVPLFVCFMLLLALLNGAEYAIRFMNIRVGVSVESPYFISILVGCLTIWLILGLAMLVQEWVLSLLLKSTSIRSLIDIASNRLDYKQGKPRVFESFRAAWVRMAVPLFVCFMLLLALLNGAEYAIRFMNIRVGVSVESPYFISILVGCLTIWLILGLAMLVQEWVLSLLLKSTSLRSLIDKETQN